MSNTASFVDRSHEIRIKLRIPAQYHQDSILFKLVSQYQVEINILAALLTPKSDSDGWFDILIKGHKQAIDDALIYLQELNIEILTLNRLETDGL